MRNQSAVRSSRALVCARSASRQGTYTYVHTLNELHVWCDLVRGRWLVARPFARPFARLAARLFDLRSCGRSRGRSVAKLNYISYASGMCRVTCAAWARIIVVD